MNLFSEKHFSEAVPLFKEVISIEPTTAEPYFYLGFYNFKFAQNYAASENYLKKAIEICPDVDIYAYYFLADICYGREEWAKAKDYLTKFLSDPALIDNDVDLVRAREMLKWAKTYVDIYTKPVPFDPHYLPGVCSPLSEYMPSFSPDGEIVFYTRLIEMPPRKDDIFQKKYMKECLYASRMKDNKYDSGAEMPYPFNKTDNIGGVTVV